MTKRISEAGTIRRNPETKAFRVCLISEGQGSSADFPRSFFTQANADALAGALSFPSHPIDVDRPEHRDPLSAIGSIGNTVDVETDPVTGKIGFWADYIPSKSKPQVAEYLEEYADKLGLSIYADSDGHADPVSGRWVAESLDGGDPYKSVDLVVAAGRGGKFERVHEALRKLNETSADAGGEEEKNMEIEKEVAAVKTDVAEIKTLVENLVKTLAEGASKDAQVEADTAAAEKLAEDRIASYDKAVGLLAEAKLTESMDAELREAARKGEDIAPRIEAAQKVLAEARAGYVAEDSDDNNGVVHLGASQKITEAHKTGFEVAGFGKVAG